SKNSAFRITNADRRDVLENDRRIRKGTTFHQIAMGEADAVTGRYGAISRTHVTGAAGPEYPTLQSGPWASDAGVPAEPPLGVAIDQMEPVGTQAEIEQSLGEVGDHGDRQLPVSGDSASPDARSAAGHVQRPAAGALSPPSSLGESSPSCLEGNLLGGEAG